MLLFFESEAYQVLMQLLIDYCYLARDLSDTSVDSLLLCSVFDICRAKGSYLFIEIERPIYDPRVFAFVDATFANNIRLGAYPSDADAHEISPCAVGA